MSQRDTSERCRDRLAGYRSLSKICKKLAEKSRQESDSRMSEDDFLLGVSSALNAVAKVLDALLAASEN